MVGDFFHYFIRGIGLLAWFLAAVFVIPALTLTIIAWAIGTTVTGPWVAVGIVLGIVFFFSGWFAWLNTYGEGF